MLFLIVGLLLLLMKVTEFGPGADLGWLIVLAPFGMAALWWWFVDSFGITQRRAMEKMEKRKVERRERDMKALGLDVRRERRVQVVRDQASRRGDAPPAAAEPPRRDPRI